MYRKFRQGYLYSCLREIEAIELRQWTINENVER